MPRLLLTLACLAIPACAQPVTIGAEGGLLLIGYPAVQGPSRSKPYLVGPMVEVRLPRRFGFEFDALYSRLGNQYYIPTIAMQSTTRQIADAWQFPLLAKYHFPVPVVHPYASAGVAPREVSGKTDGIQYGYYASDVSFSSSTWSAADVAFVLGGGLEFRLGRVRIAPEVRWLRWSDPWSSTYRGVAGYLQVPAYEGQFLLGIGWRGK